MSKTALVLEGGGMRGLYTAGVLDCFLDQQIGFDYIIGVSAGVCHGISFLAGQRGRTRHINLHYSHDKRYISLHNFLHTGSVFGMDFVFDEIPTRLEPFDYAAFRRSKTEFVIGVTDVETGKPAFFYKKDSCAGGDMARLNLMARASSAIPVFSRIVSVDGRDYLDGGTSAPIPFEQALADGCSRIVAVLTRDRSFVRQPEPHSKLYHRLFRRTPAMAHCLDIRHEVYNGERERLFQLEKSRRAFVLAPRTPVSIGRFERGEEALDALYHQGYSETLALCPALEAFLGGEPESVVSGS